MKKRPAKRIGSRGSPTAPPTNAWPKGVSGNPDGRPKTDPELVEAFRARTPKALAVLDKVLDGYINGPSVDEEGVVQGVKAQDAVKASEIVINRGWGTAPATVKLEATVSADVRQDVQHSVAAKPEPARLARVAAVLQKAGVLDALNAAAQPKLEAAPEVSADVSTGEEP